MLAGVCGCGNTAKVTGKVTYQGRPVGYGSVIFLSADKTARSGVIEPDGSYTVEGVPPGTVKIGVISRDPSRGRSRVRRDVADASPPRQDRGWFPLPPKFEARRLRGLACAVGSGRVSHDIDLK